MAARSPDGAAGSQSDNAKSDIGGLCKTNDTEEKEKDVFRDTPVRYLGKLLLFVP